jgi:2EXR family
MQYYGSISQEPSLYEVTDSKPLKKFTLFPELPFEIRLVIWQISILQPDGSAPTYP